MSYICRNYTVATPDEYHGTQFQGPGFVSNHEPVPQTDEVLPNAPLFRQSRRKPQKVKAAQKKVGDGMHVAQKRIVWITRSIQK